MHPADMDVTPRETQVLSWVAAGKSDWAIGQILRISSKTVNFHVENAKRKLGAGTRVQAVVAALREGMICSRESECCCTRYTIFGILEDQPHEVK